MASKIVVTGRVAAGYHATLGVHTDVPRPYKYQWKKNGFPIAGASSAPSYTTPELRQDELTNRYSVIVTGFDGAQRIEEETPMTGLFKEK